MIACFYIFHESDRSAMLTETSGLASKRLARSSEIVLCQDTLNVHVRESRDALRSLLTSRVTWRSLVRRCEDLIVFDVSETECFLIRQRTSFSLRWSPYSIGDFPSANKTTSSWRQATFSMAGGIGGFFFSWLALHSLIF